MLGLHVTGAQDKVVSARLNLSYGTIYIGRVCNFLGSVWTQQKFEAMDGPVLQLSFVWQAKENTFARHAAVAVKSLQSCPALCDPIDGSPPGSPVPGILQARTLEWVAISFSNASK